MKRGPRVYILLLVSAFLLSCEDFSARIFWLEKIAPYIPLIGGAEKTQNVEAAPSNNFLQADNATTHLDQNNEELARIAENARNTLPLFFRRLLEARTGEDAFCVKYPFRADNNSSFSMEQLWLGNIEFKDGVYYGTIVNTPFYTKNIKKGDIVSFSATDITDWMYVSNKKITGGHSIKYLLDQMPEHERSEDQWAILKMFEK